MPSGEKSTNFQSQSHELIFSNLLMMIMKTQNLDLSLESVGKIIYYKGQGKNSFTLSLLLFWLIFILFFNSRLFE